MLREGYEMTSPEIALVHRGERVLLLQEAPRGSGKMWQVCVFLFFC